MRNFEQRMDEIHSRSKARIARRRKIVAACVPLVLCLAITAICFLPYSAHTAGETTGMSATSYSASVTVLMQEVNGKLVYVDSESAEEFIAYVSSLSVDSSRLHIAGGIDAHTQTTTHTAPAQTLYQITVTDAQGVTVNYTLESTILTHKDSGTVYYLSSVQRLEILKLLGLG
jgi:hypothetical protein